MENKFRTDNKQTQEEFLAQFRDSPEEIVVKVQWVWTKGSSGFPKFGREELVHMRYMEPWEADDEHPIGTGGTVYWFARRRIIGCPYPPRFLQNTCYRLRVRRCRSGQNFLLLDEILESNVDVALEESIYRKVYDRYMNRFTGEKREVLIHCVKDVQAARVKRASGMAIGYAYLDYSAIIDDGTGIPKMVGRCMDIPVDDRNFKENKSLRLKAGSNYKIQVNIQKGNSSRYSFDRLLASHVSDEGLTAAGREAVKPVKWAVEGFGDFDIHWDKIGMKASSEAVKWDPSDERGEVSVYLCCDPDNCHTAYRTTDAFLKLYRDREAFEEKVFSAVAEEFSDDAGMVETWDDETGAITKEELKKRLRISFLSFDEEGVDIMLDLDDLFTDHGYSLYMYSDGTLKLGGLWG